MSTQRTPESATSICVMLANTVGGGLAQYRTLPRGTTIMQLFNNEIGGNPAGYRIKVGDGRMQGSADAGGEGGNVAHDYQLRHGDRVSIGPAKIAGAVRRFFTAVARLFRA